MGTHGVHGLLQRGFCLGDGATTFETSSVVASLSAVPRAICTLHSKGLVVVHGHKRCALSKVKGLRVGMSLPPHLKPLP